MNEEEVKEFDRKQKEAILKHTEIALAIVIGAILAYLYTY